jgi:hypothetical protein
LLAFRRATVGKKHVHKADGDNITMKPERGTSRAYTLDRLERERPDLFAKVKAGVLSANAAAIADRPALKVGTTSARKKFHNARTANAGKASAKCSRVLAPGAGGCAVERHGRAPFVHGAGLGEYLCPLFALAARRAEQKEQRPPRRTAVLKLALDVALSRERRLA